MDGRGTLIGTEREYYDVDKTIDWQYDEWKLKLKCLIISPNSFNNGRLKWKFEMILIEKG